MQKRIDLRIIDLGLAVDHNYVRDAKLDTE